MGSSYSTPDEKTNTTDKVENIKRLFSVDDSVDLLETLNISDFKLNDNKLPLPIIGGTNYVQNGENGEDGEDGEDGNVDFDLVGGGQNNDVRFMSKKRRYLRHNIFKILSQLDGVNKSQKGGDKNEDEKYLSTSSDDAAIKHIKNIILREVNKLNSDTNNQSGGDCGCDGNKGRKNSNNEQLGGAKKKSKKVAKKTKTTKTKSKKAHKQRGGSRKKTQNKDLSSSSSSDSSSSNDSEESYHSKNESTLNQSESSLDSKDKDTSTESESESETENSENAKTNSDSESDNDSEQKSDDSDKKSQKGGLSIFPFNSSEIKSTVSEKKNMRMIRRKI
jgi:hypothetical protein